jgi:hypothetical protein
VSGPANSANIDTQIRLGAATTNFGTDAALFVGVANGTGKVFRTIMEFQLTGTGGVPAGAVVTDCRLRLNVTQRTKPTAGHIRRLCSARWLDGNGLSETQATWNNFRTGTPWGTPGAGLTSTACENGGDYATSQEVAYTPPAGTGLFTFPNMASLCQDALTSQGGWLRLRISQDAESTLSNLIKFDSTDASTAANRPRLSVTWSLP